MYPHESTAGEVQSWDRLRHAIFVPSFAPNLRCSECGMSDAYPPEPPQQPAWVRDEQLHLLSLSGTLAGLSITGVTLFHTMRRGSEVRTIADAVLAGSALMFLLCTYFIFFALRTKRRRLAPTLVNIADGLFLLALTGMVGAGMIMVYTVW